MIFSNFHIIYAFLLIIAIIIAISIVLALDVKRVGTLKIDKRPEADDIYKLVFNCPFDEMEKKRYIKLKVDVTESHLKHRL